MRRGQIRRCGYGEQGSGERRRQAGQGLGQGDRGPCDRQSSDRGGRRRRKDRRQGPEGLWRRQGKGQGRSLSLLSLQQEFRRLSGRLFRVPSAGEVAEIFWYIFSSPP